MKNWSLNSIIVVSALIIGLSIIIGFYAINIDKKSDYVTVTSQSMVEIKPDKTAVYFSINTLESTPEETQAKNTKIVEDVKNALLKLKIPASSLVTTNYYLYNKIDWTENGSIDKGYDLTHTLKVTCDISQASAVVETGIKNGVNSIERIEYITTKDAENEAVAKAMEKATLTAKSKAKEVAKSLNSRLGRVLKVEEGGWWITTSNEIAEVDSSSEIPAEYSTNLIMPQKMAVQANVNVVFALN